MSTPLYRHGDVFLRATLPPTGPLQPTGHLVLAHGEVTGHAHRIAETHAAQLYEAGGPNRYLHVTAAHATLTHEEHAPIRLPGGWYRVWRQREYTPGSVRVVLD
ncbi:hypothetical protein V3W47_12450 [Deinococcus sp. YIM 134068]|uniref:hypothetical protein n=1 Tax=Deinococcus lichenicola TaxID=3118910 RepID=UPI002F924B17